MDAGRRSSVRPASPPSSSFVLPMQQQTSPVPLSKRTSSRYALSRTYLADDDDDIDNDNAAAAAAADDDEPPSTPVPAHRRRRRRSSKGKQPAAAAAAAHDPAPRQTSWSSTTRDSVVDNLLQSLDTLPGGQPQPLAADEDDAHDLAFDREKYRLPAMPQFPPPYHQQQQQQQQQQPALPLSTRPRTHTYSSSLSSGYDSHGPTVTADSPASKYSGGGRRSHSSSNFAVRHSTKGKVNAVRQMDAAAHRGSSDTLRFMGHGAGAAHGSSDLDSVDYARSALHETNRLNWGGRRSVSMDQIYAEAQDGGPSVLNRGRPVPSVYSKYEGKYEANYDEAAPEPGVPAGPRKKLNPSATGPVYVNPTPSRQNLRKVNTQTDLRAATRPSPPIPQYIHDQAIDFVRGNSMRGVRGRPLPADQAAPAPSPDIKTTRPDAPPSQYERPGFFKRVFGGGGGGAGGGSGSRVASGQSDRSDLRDSFAHSDRGASGAYSRPPWPHDPSSQLSPDSAATTSYPPPSLGKKPSSFFRRRKKSTSNSLRPMPLSLGAIGSHARSAEPSPSVSSLRKVMDPFLSHDAAAAAAGPSTPHARGEDLPRPATRESTEGTDDLDIFHSGYTTPADTSLGTRDQLRGDAFARASQSHMPVDVSKMKIKMKKRKTQIASPPSEPAAPQAPSVDHSRFAPDVSRKRSTVAAGEAFASQREKAQASLKPDFPPTRLDSKRADKPVNPSSASDRIVSSRSNSVADTGTEMRSFSASTNVSTLLPDEELAATQRPSGESAFKSGTIRARPSALGRVESADGTQRESAEPVAPAEGSRNGSQAASLAVSPAMQSTADSSVYHSAASSPLPSVQVEGKEVPRKSMDNASSTLADEGTEYRERARKIFEGDEEDVSRLEAASWLGEKTTLSAQTLHAYMRLFDFTDLNILAALRALCGKLLLRGETQQFDRIITALSERWCDCNPNHGFKAQDVVHTIVYSLILLNTDLHLADIGEKMSKTAYVKNTLPTIRRVVADAAPDAFNDSTKSSPSVPKSTAPLTESAPSATATGTLAPSQAPAEQASPEGERPTISKRLSLRPGVFRTESDIWTQDSANSSASNALVKQPWTGNIPGWEFEIETILKSFFSSIRSEPLPLLSAPSADASGSERNLTAANFSGLRRSGSIVSKTPSDSMSQRSKPGFRTMTMTWQNRNNRSRPKVYPASTFGSSRTSLDDGSSVWSPAQGSSSWSKNSYAKTLTSSSMNSLGHHLSTTESGFKHSIGFANALSQTIISEEGTGYGAADAESISVPTGLLEDEALVLEGAPWAKEGLVKHKHHLETHDRKARERNWTDCFAVISKGKMTLFAFNTTTKSHSLGRKALQKHAPAGGRAASIAAPRVGGGDWMGNAEQLDSFVLRQTIASVLPPPGYSKMRPHVWALSLPSGAVHLFQVGTPDIAKEFMSTANYWSARLSKEPLSSSVSNVEYGWSEQVINPALLERTESITSPPPSIHNVHPKKHIHTSSGSTSMGRPSFQSSLRGSSDAGFGAKARLPGDRVHIAQWQPPTQSLMASQLLEVDQLRSLTAYVSSVEAELEKHNELKHAIQLTYSYRHSNYNRALNNWQQKSDYLLREIVKFRTYIDSLTAAQRAKEEYDARKADREARKGSVSPEDNRRPKGDADFTIRPPHTAG